MLQTDRTFFDDIFASGKWECLRDISDAVPQAAAALTGRCESEAGQGREHLAGSSEGIAVVIPSVCVRNS